MKRADVISYLRGLDHGEMEELIEEAHPDYYGATAPVPSSFPTPFVPPGDEPEDSYSGPNDWESYLKWEEETRAKGIEPSSRYEWDIIIKDVDLGASMLDVYKVFRKHEPSASIAGVKRALTVGLPYTFKERLGAYEAKELKDEFEAAGAVIEIR